MTQDFVIHSGKPLSILLGQNEVKLKFSYAGGCDSIIEVRMQIQFVTPSKVKKGAATQQKGRAVLYYDLP